MKITQKKATFKAELYDFDEYHNELVFIVKPDDLDELMGFFGDPGLVGLKAVVTLYEQEVDNG